MRVMMLGPYPRSPHRIDGGVAAAMTYLSEELAAQPGLELFGVRIAGGVGESGGGGAFGWPISEVPLGRFGLTTFYRQQRATLKKLIDRIRPDIVHAQGVDVEGMLAVSCGVRTVVTVHGVLGETAKYKADLFSWARASLTAMVTERPTVRLAKDLIAISPYVTNHYRREIRGRVHEIPNAVAPRYFEIARSPEKGRLLFAGRVTKGKGVIDLIRAMALAPEANARIVLAGSCPDRNYENLVRNEAQRLGVATRVEFAGLLDEHALLRELSRAEALMLPSYQETAPMVVQQAMAAGIAVIASDVGGIPFQIENGATGLLHEPGNVSQIAGAIRRLHLDAMLSSRLGQAAKTAASALYDAKRVARATRSVYESILEESRGTT